MNLFILDELYKVWPVDRFHLYTSEVVDGMSSPPEPDVSVFTVNDVKIGLLTCFDLLYQRPLSDLVASQVDVVAFPHYWYDELPFLTGIFDCHYCSTSPGFILCTPFCVQ